MAAGPWAAVCDFVDMAAEGYTPAAVVGGIAVHRYSGSVAAHTASVVAVVWAFLLRTSRI